MTEEITTIANTASAVKAKTVAEVLSNPTVILDDQTRKNLQNVADLSIKDLDHLLQEFGPPSNRLAKPQPVDLRSFKTRLRAGRK